MTFKKDFRYPTLTEIYTARNPHCQKSYTDTSGLFCKHRYSLQTYKKNKGKKNLFILKQWMWYICVHHDTPISVIDTEITYPMRLNHSNYQGWTKY